MKKTSKAHFLKFLSILVLVSLFLNLWISPVLYEEGRRILIALEIALSGEFVTITELGAPYCKKPPLYNYLIYGVSMILGGFSELSSRLLSVFSLIAMAILLISFSDKYINRKAAWLSSLGFVVSLDIYYYFSMTGEIDLFYSFLVLTSIFSIYHFHRNSKILFMFLIPWICTGLGFLTKGFHL